MKLNQYSLQDWLLIRRQLIWFGTAMLVAGLILLVTQAYVFFSEKELAAQQTRIREITGAADLAFNNWQAMQRFEQQYAQMMSKGIVGPEHRLDWVEALAELNRRNGALALDYTFAPQRVKEGAVGEQDLMLFASEMKVQYLAQNEWDFSSFNAWLAKLPGKAIPRSCELKRNDEAGIDVMCLYDWITIAPAKPVEVKP
ncbi:hypothetical protein HQ393_11470 [Chitinibacter bivalviorum]|uniref:Uncharacterized protein n=1 Tax=Chitinibacter bivalviorum TaxID=2739434 RepID=A0A7H9BLB4_9NEIS|nr:hypothetical protein [Chitinibacter bivalviorum]QLG88801.1 hypothetical protein HQ393_11470 [Chitinibacter bivalviorum]